MSRKFDDYRIITGPVVTEKSAGHRMEYNQSVAGPTRS